MRAEMDAPQLLYPSFWKGRGPDPDIWHDLHADKGVAPLSIEVSGRH